MVTHALTPNELLHRIMRLEQGAASVNQQLTTQAQTLQTIQAEQQAASDVVFGHQNYIRNGDFDTDRNRYVYATDYTTGTPGVVAADVSHEVAHWYTAEPDTAVEAIGSISASDATLVISGNTFGAGDAGEEIVVEGAGTAGADLITTIASVTNTTTVELTDAADTTVSNVRVRYRLRKLWEDATDSNSTGAGGVAINGTDTGDSNNSTNSSLKTSAHSRYGTTVNIPDYDKVNGWARMSNTNWLCCPLSKNFFFPSKRYLLSFIYKLNDWVDDSFYYPVTIVAGLWDNSPGRRCFIEGNEIDVTAEAVGTPGTTTREYFVVFTNGWGETIGSKKVTITDAPSDAQYITNQRFVRLEWETPTGAVNAAIYMREGSNYWLIGLPYPTNGWNDNGLRMATEIGFPAVDRTRPQAMIKTTPYNFSDPNIYDWQEAQFNIPVPTNYNKGLTTDKQWFVMYLETPITGIGAERSLLVDRISLDDKYGVFTYCPLDFTAPRGNSTSPTIGNQGGVGTGNPPINPGGTGFCPVFEMPVEVEHNGKRAKIPAWRLVDNEHQFKIVNRDDKAVGYRAEVGGLTTVYKLEAEDEEPMICSFDHPCFESYVDVIGKPLQEFNVGDTILTRNGLKKVVSNVAQVKKRHTVKITLVGEQKGYWINNYCGHNAKQVPLEL